jgi:type I restriction enzyme S subunit
MYTVNSPTVRAEIISLASGTTRQRVSGGNLKMLQLPSPPPSEQRRIVAKLDSLLAHSKRAHDELGRVPKLVERCKEAILASAFRGDLTADWRYGRALEIMTNDTARIDGRIGRLHELPSGWGWQNIGSVGEVAGGLTKNSNRQALPLSVSYLRVANVYANELRLDDVQKIGCTAVDVQRTQLSPGDLLIVEGNGSIEQIGRVAQWNGEIAECVHQNHLIRLRPRRGLPSRYVLYWLASSAARRAIEVVASSSSGLHTLSISKVQGLPIPIASEEEMAVIIGKIEAAFARIGRFAAEADRAANLLRRLDQATLTKAFRGELVPHDLTEEPIIPSAWQINDEPSPIKTPRVSAGVTQSD